MSESPYMSSPSPPPPSLSGPKRYRPPQPDSNTFDTQQEFLDSLHPVPIDTIASNNMRCPHCWKDYGQSDPGFDNAEDPVKLRCGHVFGEKCLKEDIFALPKTVRIDLVPLTFEPGSKGADLGRRLSAWVDQCGVEKGSLLLGGNREKDFTKLLTEFQKRSSAETPLGAEWGAVLSGALVARPRVERVHIMENAVVFDVSPTPPAKPEVAFFSSSQNISVNSSAFGGVLSTYNALDTLHQHSASWLPTLTNFPFDYGTSETGSFSPSTPTFSFSSGNHSDPGLSYGTDMLSSGKADSPTPQKTDTTAGSTDDNGINYAKVGPKKKSLKKDSMKQKLNKTASSSIPTKLNTDSDVEVAKAKMDAVFKKLDDPTLTSFLPYPLQSQMAGDPSDSAEQYLNGSNGSTHISASQAIMSTALAGVSKAEEVKAGKSDVLDHLHNNVKVSLYTGAHDKALAVVKSAEKKKAKQQEQQIMAEKRAKKAIEEQEAMRKEMISLFATALKAIYEEYEQTVYDQALAAGQPPPVKKLRLASSNAKPVTSTKSSIVDAPCTDPAQLRAGNVVNVAVVVHMRDEDTKGYEVPQPFIFASGPVGNDGDDEDEVDENDVEGDLNPASKIYFLSRTRCSSCPLPKTTSTGFSALPEFITWRDSKKVTDDCPLCRKVLFRKTEQHHARRIHD